MRAGPRNLITDVAGIRVGNAANERCRTGVTVLTAASGNRAAVHAMGGAPGTRETDALAPHNIVEGVDAIVLSGGSAFGLDAAGAVQAALARRGRGFEVLGHRVPIVPAAILFDLANGGAERNDGLYRELGLQALDVAHESFDLGSAGAGYGAVTGGWNGTERFGLRGGLGSASALLDDGTSVGALVAVNALGSPCDVDGRFLAAPFELDDEFGGRGTGRTPLTGPLPIKRREVGTSTTIGIVATDANLSKAQCLRLAMAAHDGYARALWPAHTPLDGDLIFAVSTGAGAPPDVAMQIELSGAAAAVTARAIARGVYAAAGSPDGAVPSYRNAHG